MMSLTHLGDHGIHGGCAMAQTPQFRAQTQRRAGFMPPTSVCNILPHYRRLESCIVLWAFTEQILGGLVGVWNTLRSIRN